MRIPLDYYRILGLPIQATAEQLKQAHRDRTLQLPRREYSDLALDTRKQLLDEAYAILSDADQRQAYDMGFLAKTYDQEAELKLSGLGKRAVTEGWGTELTAESPSPSIEIEDKQFVGALLLLQELGEYEQVVKLSAPYLRNGSIGLKDGRFGDPELILSDVVLTVGLAYLELGREHWQQGQYENAAQSLEAGQDLLLRENLFASLRGEMQADLYKLRPFRILELLQLPLEKMAERRKGLQLLREMLHERGGIDGHGDDQSGLGVEDFLRFVQQLRRYLTTSEQLSLFETEARRPSAVATYLAVYALIAQGFAEAQPALIRKAKLMLMQLGRRQDVHLEKAVTALLLGQTEEASRSLELSQEREPIAFIRENSPASPDLLPGLCLYAERWLQDEVFPHFRDLIDRAVSLTSYFSNEQVQSYLEALPAEGSAANEWVVVQPRRGSGNSPTSSKSSLQPRDPAVAGTLTGATFNTSTATFTSSPSPTASQPQSLSQTPLSASLGNSRLAETGSPSTTLQEKLPSTTLSSSEPVSASPPPPASRTQPPSSSSTPTPTPGTLSRRSPHGRRSRKIENTKIMRLIAVGAIALLAFWIVWSVLALIWKGVASTFDSLSGPTLSGEQAMVLLDQPPLPIPEPQTVNLDSETVTPELAQAKISQWFSAKAAALGSEHKVEALQEILVDPALARWVATAEAIRQEGSYRTYEHNLKINQVRMDQTNPNQALVDAEVREKAQFYEQGELTNTQDDTLQIQYRFIRRDNTWRIEDWQVMR